MLDLGRPSIALERSLLATLLPILYSIRSEPQLVERIEFDLLFRRFVGPSIEEKVPPIEIEGDCGQYGDFRRGRI
jgi:hypothetical protein